jgi:hypothetical protein
VNCFAAAMLVLGRKLFLGENFRVADEPLAIRKRYGVTDITNTMLFRVTRLSCASLVVAFVGCGGSF